MNAQTLVDIVLRGGGTIEWDGRNVRVNGPQDVVTPELVEMLRGQREDVIAIVSNRPSSSGYEAIPTMSLDDFAVARLAIPIIGEVLKERVYIASDNAEIEIDDLGRHNGCVVYRASELRLLANACADTVRTIHEVKKVFGDGVLS